QHRDPKRGLWARWAREIANRPLLAGLAALMLLIPLAIPLLSLNLGQKDTAALSTSTTARRAYDLISKNFGAGVNGPLIVAVSLSFVLLVLAFRTVVVPVQAAVMNVLSIGAAYGVLTAIFQYGWAHSLIGLSGSVPIDSYVPLFMLAILFGLSMDYEVFLVSQI